MADFSALKTAIQNNIKQNGNEEITGSILQQILLAIVDTLGDSAINGLITDLSNEVTARQNADTALQQGINSEASTRGSADITLQNNINSEATARSSADTALQNAINAIHTQIDNGYVYAGIATPSTSPATGKVFYIAVQAGTYTNFGSTVVTEGITILRYVGSAWVKEQVIYGDGGVFDVTAQNGGATFASLEALMSDDNLSTLIPAAVRKGGMSIKFVCTSDNKYIHYNLIADEFTTDTTQWAIADEGVYVENPEFVYVKTDAEGKILWAIKTDGGIYYGAGVPQQVIDYIEEKLAGFSPDEYGDIVAFLNGLEEGDKTLQTLLNEKVDKEEGKSLINADYASSQSAIDNPEYLQVTTDAEGKLLEGIKKNGKKVIPGGIEGLEEKVQDTVNNTINTEFANKSTTDKFSEQGGQLLWDGEPIESGSISSLVIDLPVSDGTDIESGYAYIDITDRTIKVKA